MISIIGLNKIALLVVLCDQRNPPIDDVRAFNCINNHPDFQRVREMILNSDEIDPVAFDAVVGHRGSAAALIAGMRVHNAHRLDERYLQALDTLADLNEEAIADPTKSSLTYAYYVRTGGGLFGPSTAERVMRETHFDPERADAFYATKTEEELTKLHPGCTVTVPLLDDAGQAVFP